MNFKPHAESVFVEASQYYLPKLKDRIPNDGDGPQMDTQALKVCWTFHSATTRKHWNYRAFPIATYPCRSIWTMMVRTDTFLCLG